MLNLSYYLNGDAKTLYSNKLVTLNSIPC